MQIIAKNIWTVVILLAVFTGLMLNRFFPFIYLLMGTIAAIGLTFLGFLGDVVTKSSKGIRITGFIFVFFLVATITSFARQRFSEQSATTVANKVIKEAYKFKRIKGHFPPTIDALHLERKTIEQFKKKQSYSVDSSKQNFQIRSWDDGWNIKIFYSSDSSWIWTD